MDKIKRIRGAARKKKMNPFLKAMLITILALFMMAVGFFAASGLNAMFHFV